MGKEVRLTAGMYFLPRLNQWGSMYVNYYDVKEHSYGSGTQRNQEISH